MKNINNTTNMNKYYVHTILILYIILIIYINYINSFIFIHNKFPNSLASFCSTNEIENILNHLETNILHEKFGHQQFRIGQREVISNILLGKSTLVIFPTGQGKSLLYMLPSQILQGITIVVSPLLALVRDQVEYLTSRQIPASRIDSTMTYDDIKLTNELLLQGKIKILFVSPERFNNENFKKLIRKLKISLFVVDEAHCISEWGHAFRPDYLRLSKFASDSLAPLRLALTATATSRVSKDIATTLGISNENIIRLPSIRKNIKLAATCFKYPLDDYFNKLEVLLQFFSNTKGASIVYCNKQKTTEKIAKDMNERGYSARFYHSAMNSEEREEVENWFLDKSYNELPVSQETPIVIGTIAFGMGVDRSDIRNIIHFDIPRSIEDYIQGIGRSGRDGLEAKSVCYLSDSDIQDLRSQYLGSTLTMTNIEKLISIINSDESRPCIYDDETIYVNFYDISQELDVNELSLRLALSYLVQQDILIELTSSYRMFKVSKIDKKALEIFLNNQEMEEQLVDENITSSTTTPLDKVDLIQSLASLIDETFIRDKKTRELKYVTIDAFEIANILRVKPNVVNSLLLQFKSSNICSLSSMSKISSRFQQLSWRKYSSNELISMIYNHAMENLRRNLNRINEVVSLLSKYHSNSLLALDINNASDEIWEQVGAYFDETSDDNGQETGNMIDWLETSNFDESQWNKIVQLVQRGDLPSNDPLFITRFATGVMSPLIARKRLRSKKKTIDELELDDCFGCCRSADWHMIIQKSSELCR